MYYACLHFDKKFCSIFTHAHSRSSPRERGCARAAVRGPCYRSLVSTESHAALSRPHKVGAPHDLQTIHCSLVDNFQRTAPTVSFVSSQLVSESLADEGSGSDCGSPVQEFVLEDG